MSRRRTLTATALSATALLAAGPATQAQAADPFTAQIKKLQQQWQKQWEASMKRMQLQWQDQWKSLWIKKGQNPDAPYVARGFTVGIPLQGGITQVGGLGTNSTGTAAAVAVGTLLGGTGDLYLVDTVRLTTQKVPQGVSLPFDGKDAISLDGRRVVFNSGLGPLTRSYAYVRGSNAAVQLTTKESSQPVLSSDGKTYALQTEGGIFGKDTIAIGDPTAGSAGLETIATAANNTTHFHRPQVSGDGRYTAWIQTVGSTATFKQYDRRTKATISTNLADLGLPAGGAPVFADWSWNSRYLLVTRTTGSVRTVYLVDLKGSTRVVTTLPAAVNGESSPTLRADAARVAVATPRATDTTDTNNATDLAWVNIAGTRFERQSFADGDAQLPNGIGLTQLGTRIPRFAVADTGVASFWVEKAPGLGAGELLYVRTTLPVVNTAPPAAE